MEVTVNNLTNATTPGYQRDDAQVEAFPSMLLAATGGSRDAVLAADLGSPIGTLSGGAFVGAVNPNFSPGELRQTGRNLDVALHGPGFFTVQTPAGLAYTRRGDFRLSPQGQLVTFDGNPVLVGGRPVGNPGAKVEIGTDGTVRVNGRSAGRLDVVQAAGLGPLQRTLPGYFVPAEAPVPGVPAPAVSNGGPISLQVGALEDANVNPVTETVQLMAVVRSYEANQKAIQVQDETLGRAVSELGKVY